MTPVFSRPDAVDMRTYDMQPVRSSPGNGALQIA
jgi:hypothetical protein